MLIRFLFYLRHRLSITLGLFGLCCVSTLAQDDPRIPALAKLDKTAATYLAFRDDLATIHADLLDPAGISMKDFASRLEKLRTDKLVQALTAQAALRALDVPAFAKNLPSNEKSIPALLRQHRKTRQDAPSGLAAAHVVARMRDDACRFLRFSAQGEMSLRRPVNGHLSFHQKSHTSRARRAPSADYPSLICRVPVRKTPVPMQKVPLFVRRALLLAAVSAAGNEDTRLLDDIATDQGLNKCLAFMALMRNQCVAAADTMRERAFCSTRHGAHEVGMCILQATR